MNFPVAWLENMQGQIGVRKQDDVGKRKDRMISGTGKAFEEGVLYRCGLPTLKIPEREGREGQAINTELVCALSIVLPLLPGEA